MRGEELAPARCMRIAESASLEKESTAPDCVRKKEYPLPSERKRAWPSVWPWLASKLTGRSQKPSVAVSCDGEPGFVSAALAVGAPRREAKKAHQDSVRTFAKQRIIDHPKGGRRSVLDLGSQVRG